MLSKLANYDAVVHPVKGAPLHLRPNQIPHFIRCCEIFTRHHGMVDTSRMGLGKSIIKAALSRYYNLPLFIIGPLTSFVGWKDVQDKYALDVIEMIGYQSLRSVKGKQPRHEYLTRHETEKGVRFEVTEKFTRLVESGILLVIDEFHHIKNDSDQHRACRAMTMEIMRVGGLSRFSLLSGSPVDKEEHVVNLLRLIGYIQSTQLSEYNKERAELHLIGAQELIDVCRYFDPEGTDEVLSSCPFDHKSVPTLCFRLYIDVLQDQITSAMHSNKEDHDLKNVRNGYFNMSPQAEADYQTAINEMSAAARFNPVLQTIHRRSANFGAITTALMHSERAKLEIFERITRKYLNDRSEPGILQKKVIIFLNFIPNILDLAERLKDCNPLVMYGETPASERGNIIAKFQQPDNQYCVAIMNPRVGGESTNFPDLDGRFLRVTLYSPDHDVTKMHQASGRTCREGSKSRSDIIIVYGKIGMRETSILNALARKSDVMRLTLKDQVEDGIRFPGDYVDEFEADDDSIVLPDTTITDTSETIPRITGSN